MKEDKIKVLNECIEYFKGAIYLSQNDELLMNKNRIIGYLKTKINNLKYKDERNKL